MVCWFSLIFGISAMMQSGQRFNTRARDKYLKRNGGV